MRFFQFLSGFKSDARGVAAIEMALVAPVIAGLAFTSVNLWEATMRRQSMDQALRVGSQYYLQGGSADADARGLALAAWQNKPAGADISISRLYRCGDAVVTLSTPLCGSELPPAIFAKLTATATSEGAVFQAAYARSEIVRVR